MKTMNLFGTQEKPKRKIYSEDFKRKAVTLANKIGNSNAAKELGVSPSSISNWKKSFSSASINHAPIQDSEGNLTFSLDGNTYTLNVNSEEERNSVLAKVNFNSEYTWDWFKEETGKKHWVLYNIEMYKILINYTRYEYKCLNYSESSNLAPTIPINATSCFQMFSYCMELTNLDLTYFDTSQVTDMSFMFCGCSSLTSLNLSNFDTRQVTNMTFMFSYCNSLTSLDVTNFDTSQVEDMSHMFISCRTLRSLNVTNFDTSQVTDMSFMFCGCSSLTSLDVTNFDTSNVTNMRYIFYDCTSLKMIKVSAPKLIKCIRKDYKQIQIA